MSYPERFRRPHTRPSRASAVAATFVAWFSVLTPAAGLSALFDKGYRCMKQDDAAWQGVLG